MKCEYLNENKCGFTKKLIGLELPTTNEICTHCINSSSPRDFNKATGSLCAGYLLQNNKFDFNNIVHIQIKEILSVPEKGPGTELRKLIWWFIWYKKSKRCDKCTNREQQMNRWGVEGCLKNKRRILVWLRQSAKEQGLPFSVYIASVMIDRAIRKSM